MRIEQAIEGNTSLKVRGKHVSRKVDMRVQILTSSLCRRVSENKLDVHDLNQLRVVSKAQEEAVHSPAVDKETVGWNLRLEESRGGEYHLEPSTMTS